MGDPRGFINVKRQGAGYRPVCDRTKDYREVIVPRPDKVSEAQASRCMDCGTPTCHWGCPVGNYIPEWNDLVFHNRWGRAFELLDATNSLPEVTGRVCPATCEYACILGLNDDPVTIRENELAIIEHAFKNGIICARPPRRRTGKKVAVIGSGPAGLSCADQLNRFGHTVTVFEKDDRPGGILRYGIPDFKLDKKVLDRRLALFTKEGIRFKTGVHAGVDVRIAELRKNFDAICLAGGSRQPRDLNIEGRDLGGIHFAMDYLIQSNKRVGNRQKTPQSELIDAKGKRVVVIGGGDTGADCVGTAHRQGAACVVQIEVLPRPPECRTEGCAWPKYPVLLKNSTSHEEGGERRWSILTKRFGGENGKVKRLYCVRADSVQKDEFVIEADLVILAIGFLHPEHDTLLNKLGVEFDTRGNVKAGTDYMTSVNKVFSAGDMRRGQSLVVWAIAEGRAAACNIDRCIT